MLGVARAQSLGEEAAELTLRRSFAIHVRVGDHLVESEAALGVIAQHAGDEVLEVLWRCEGAAVARRNLDAVLPEEVRTTVVDMLEDGVGFHALAFSHGDSRQNHEKNATKREHVRLEGIVGLAEAHFRSHVARGTNVSLEIALDIDSLCCAEVCNFDCEVLVQQNILHFEVPMGHASLVDVLHASQNGTKDQADAGVRDLGLSNDNVEQLATNNVVEDQIVASVGGTSVGRLESGTFSVVMHFDHVQVVELAIGIELFVEAIGASGLENFNCVGLAILLSFVDSAIGAFADWVAI